MEAQPTKSAEARWNDEAAFFDGTAHKIDVQPLDPATLRRYSGRVRRRFSPEYRFRVVNPLAGKKVLEIGCGDGHTSVLLARRGANVTGIDISSKLIDIARRRSKINEVDDRCRFLCGPIETADLPENSFDIIWGDAILHHLIPELPSVLPKLTRLAKPNSILIFAEPVNFCHLLRRIRFLIPVKAEATPDERPLEKQ
jgi:2-polyprenyl-3-methyl-5-hydroxy-6-metoxy-1,4-benzoquinol methylase